MTNLSTTLNAIKNIADESSKLKKKELLRSYKNTPYVVNMLAWLANPLITSGIAKKKMDATVKAWTNEALDDDDFLKFTIEELLNWIYLNNTGSRVVINSVYKWILKQKELDDNVDVDMLKAFVAKSYRVGMSAKSINEALGEKLVPEWQVQLAFPYADKLKLFKKDDKFAVTQKLDGIRCVFVAKKVGNVFDIHAFARSGKEIEGLTDLITGVQTLMSTITKLDPIFKEGAVFDGEILALNKNHLSTADLFQYTSKLIRTNGEKKGLEFNMFDLVPVTEFESGNFTQTYLNRRDYLNELENKVDVVNIVTQLGITTIDEISRWAALANENEWEGVMLNHVNSCYKKSRSKGLLKVKEMLTADLLVVGFKEAEEGAFKGTLSAIIVKLDENNTVDVGSGFTAEQRDYIWNHQDEYLGQVVEIQYFEVTTDRFDNKSLRFPVWKNIVRFDKTPDDVNLG